MASLYLHVPFCRRKCPYCDFFSVPEHASSLDAYPALLLKHLALCHRDPVWSGEGPLETVFFGGGTPSLLPPEAIAEILDGADRLFGIAPEAEISLEANPGTVSASRLSGYRTAGVNRISFGIQSLDHDRLRLLGRLHTPREAEEAVRLAAKAGFDNLSCDLMFALPGQSRADLLGEADRLIDLGAVHLSCYGLTVEAGTPFAHRHQRGELLLPDEETYAEHFLALHEYLENRGFGHYEISNYARPEFACRHNRVYWHRISCLGVGAGAHSFHASGWGERRDVPPDLGRFTATLEGGKDPSRPLESYDRRGAMTETLYLGLRTREGVMEADFRKRFGIGVAEAFPDAIRRADSHLRLVEGSWRLDVRGWLLFDHFISAFL